MHKCGRTAEGDRSSRIPLREFSIDRRRCDTADFLPSIRRSPLIHFPTGGNNSSFASRDFRALSLRSHFLLIEARGSNTEERKSRRKCSSWRTLQGEEGRREMFPPPPPSIFSFFCSREGNSPAPSKTITTPIAEPHLPEERESEMLIRIDTYIYIYRFPPSRLQIPLQTRNDILLIKARIESR